MALNSCHNDPESRGEIQHVRPGRFIVVRKDGRSPTVHHLNLLKKIRESTYLDVLDELTHGIFFDGERRQVAQDHYIVF